MNEPGCDHKDAAHSVLVRNRPSLAQMWRAVEDVHGRCPCTVSAIYPELKDRNCTECVDGRPVPGDRIELKDCACCGSKEFAVKTDYICLWCRYYEKFS